MFLHNVMYTEMSPFEILVITTLVKTLLSPSGHFKMPEITAKPLKCTFKVILRILVLLENEI